MKFYDASCTIINSITTMKIAAVLTATAATTTAVSGNLLRDSKTAVQKENDRRLTNSERRLATQVFDKTDLTFHPDDLLIIPDYWLIGIRTSYDGSYVAGVDDAGNVEYNYPWCTADETSPRVILV
ncbi:hypothetical protein QTG54_008473 [Skeletonema marinoi]|uniref:Uncharacterized protein n=1 Tax=Skeletonema marinoi TaxID=267567 RepID=A0AAD9DBB0_9STRA|nr:hypothetical protein QTG54_008473 [Skeletonema marinoi]